MRKSLIRVVGSGVAVLSLIGCGGSDDANAPLDLGNISATGNCSQLQGLQIAQGEIGMPSGTATIASATLVAPAAEVVTGAGASAIWNAATPAYCKVLGSIAPIDVTAPPVNFQVNLPATWNQRLLQLGGSGLDGSIPAALNNHRNAPESQAANVPGPISRGYMEAGSDGGHTNQADWPLKAEAQLNLAYGALKKTRDVAVALAKRYYGSPPKLVYFAGSSKGGQEALNVVQYYQDDYDGVFAQVPILGETGIVLNPTILLQKQLTPQTWLPRAKSPVISAEIIRQCDALDGVADFLISDYVRCNSIFSDPPAGSTPWAKIRCASGTDEGPSCLSDQQIVTLNSVHSLLTFGYDLAFGAPGFAGWGVSALPTLSRLEATQPSVATYSPLPGAVVWKGAVVGDLSFPDLTFNPLAYKTQVLALSKLTDGTNPDLARFFARGGKLILKSNTSDYTANPRELMRYYEQMKSVLGAETVAASVRYYVAPGQAHSMMNNPTQTTPAGEVLPSQWDPLGVLDDWVVGRNPPPEAVTLQQMPNVPPFTVSATRPMCQYPLYPHYLAGDRSVAASYTCRAP